MTGGRPRALARGPSALACPSQRASPFAARAVRADHRASWPAIVVLCAARCVVGSRRLDADAADHRRPGAEPASSASVAEARTETDTARERLGSRRRQRLRPGHPAAPADREPRRARRACTGYDVVVHGPVGTRGGRQSATGDPHDPGVRPRRSVPHGCGRPSSAAGGTVGVDLHASTTPTCPTAPSRAAGVAVGSPWCCPSDGGTYALYYLFPMSEEQQTLQLLRRALLTAGVLLLRARRPASPGSSPGR